MTEVPILKQENFLIVSIQKELHDEAAEKFQGDLVQKLGDTDADGVLIDVTTLDVVDSFLGRLIGDTAKMCHMMGAETVLTGLNPSIAITLTELGVELDDVHTTLNIEKGLDWLREATSEGE